MLVKAAVHVHVTDPIKPGISFIRKLVSSPIEMMHFLDPTCSLFGEGGITFRNAGMPSQVGTIQYDMVYQFSKLFHSLIFKWIRLHHN